MQVALYGLARSRPSVFGDLVWLAFVSAQAADGVLTYLGILNFGTAVEGNPIVAWYATALGPANALLGAKLLSIVCAAILHRSAMHRAVGVLTIICLLTAVRPWIALLWP
jgi:hypothetical protein